MRHHGIFSRSATLSKPLTLGRISLSIFSLALLLSARTSAHADDHVRAVRLSNVVGNVQILAGAETQFSQAYPNMPLMQGSTIKTGDDGRAEIQLEDGSVLRLTPDSSTALTILARDSAGNTKTEADLLSGLAYVEMKGTANQLFLVHFQGNEVISPAPVKFRVNLDGNPPEFAVLDGSARLNKGSEYAIDVHRNETVRLDPGDAAKYLLSQGVEQDSWDQWNLDRDQATSQMAAQETREAIGSGNTNVAGLSDLDYYGNWYSSNGTSFWVPDGAGAGWDPYGLGSWGYYGQTGGYVWISGYPWGWLPYQCGTWNYFNNFNGWGWIPGSGCWNNWGGANWYPGGGGIGNTPPGYRRLPRPTPGHPVRPVGPRVVQTRSLIPINRGVEATTLTPRLGAAPKMIAVDQGTAHLLPKSTNANPLSLNRPAVPAQGSAMPAHPVLGYSGGQRAGTVPVYRPLAPAPASSFNSHLATGAASPSRSGFSPPPSSMGSFHGSAPSAPSAPVHSSPAPSAGGGHPH